MGLGEEVKEKVEEVERKIIYDIVKELPLVPDQARGATDSRAYMPVSFPASRAPPRGRRLHGRAYTPGCCARGRLRSRVLAAR